MTKSESNARKNEYDAVIALRMLSPEEHGRDRPTPGPEWPCRLKVGGRFFEVKLLSDAPHFVPGSETNAKAKFLERHEARPFVEPNTPVEVWELRTAAKGVIQNLVDTG